MRESRDIMCDLAASGLTMAQQALVMELAATVAAEARPVADKAAENKRAYDREYQKARRKNRTTSYESRDDGSPNEVILTPSADLPDDAIASPPPRQPVSEAFAIWKEAAGTVGWTVPKVLSPARQKATSNRLREHGLDGWRACIARARASPYLAGADPPTWFTFDWLIKSGNFLKVIEGNYDRRHTDSSDPTAVALQRLHAFSGGIGAVG